MKKTLLPKKKQKTTEELKWKVLMFLQFSNLTRDSNRDVLKIEMQNISKDSSTQIDRNSTIEKLVNHLLK